MEELIELLEQKDVGKIARQEPLSKYTTMRIGGPADVFIIPKSIEALIEIATLVKEWEQQLTIIGRGSNLIISDEGIRGVVIKIDEGFDHLQINGTQVCVGAGYSIVKLATSLSRKGLSGLEFASGIPGNIGGAICMNAGAHGSDMAAIVKRVHVLLENGETKWLTNEEMEFSYRSSWVQRHNGIVLEVELQLQEGDGAIISKQIQKNKEYRKKTQPWNLPCAGSIFRNPLPQYAGKLVEEAGLKGFQLGGAQISLLHANFIVNTGDATANDVKALIQHVQRVIEERYGVKLETEVKFI